jgi:hypothetical protein
MFFSQIIGFFGPIFNNETKKCQNVRNKEEEENGRKKIWER